MTATPAPKLKKVCTRCGASNAPTARQCRKCGKNLAVRG